MGFFFVCFFCFGKMVPLEPTIMEGVRHGTITRRKEVLSGPNNRFSIEKLNFSCVKNGKIDMSSMEWF